MNVVHYYLVCLCGSLIPLANSDQNPNSFNYEQLNNYKMRRQSDPSQKNRRKAHYIVLNQSNYPKPLPKIKPKEKPPTPYHSIQQGNRLKGLDKSVYSQKFSYEPQLVGHHIIYREILDCPISYMYVETVGGVPIILRGGVGYTYFMVIAKAKPMEELTGKVKAYCLKDEEELKKNNGDQDVP